MTIAEAKKRRGVPCLYMSWSEKKQCDEISVPAVDCGMDCDMCGFNPNEALRRFAEGHYEEHDGIRTLVFTPKKGEYGYGGE